MKNKSRNSSIFSSKWAYYSLFLIAGLAISLIFLWGNPEEYPMGDSYIHFQYARNLALHGELVYNPGIEEGIGSTSFLWVAVLAFFQLLGISPLIMAKILGISMLMICSILIFEISLKILGNEPIKPRYWKSALIAGLAMFSGSMMWSVLSGMETMLFLTLVLLSIWLYSRESWIVLGVTLGLLALTRIEGISLAGVLGLVELIRHKRISSSIIKIAIPMVLVLAPWLIYLQLREGMPVSTSFQGRQMVVQEVGKRVGAQFPQFLWVLEINPLVHLACWLYYSLVFMSGIESLPGPTLDVGGNLVGTQLTIPLFTIALALITPPLVYLALKKYISSLRPISLEDRKKRLLIVIISWFLLFNLAYALFLPRPGAGGRYIPMNHMFFWLTLFGGSMLIRSKKLRITAVVFSILLFGVGVNYWRMVYQSNIHYLVEVRKEAALYINEHYPKNARVGATDLGPIGYYASQPVLDLYGHVNKEVLPFITEGGNISDYLEKEKLCYLSLFDSLEGSGLNIAKEMGLYGDPRFDLILDQSYSVSMEEWAVGNGPLRNYMPVINLYHLEWKDTTICE